MVSDLCIAMIMLLAWEGMAMFRVAVHHSRCSEPLERYRYKYDAQQKESEHLFHVKIIAENHPLQYLQFIKYCYTDLYCK